MLLIENFTVNELCKIIQDCATSAAFSNLYVKYIKVKQKATLTIKFFFQIKMTFSQEKWYELQNEEATMIDRLSYMSCTLCYQCNGEFD